MHADTATIVGLVTPVNLRFVVPVYQRPYTWDIKQCAQLWDDVLSVGRAAQEARMRSAYGSREVPTYHFTGSIVWIQDGAVSPAGVESRLLIDGQQRITTLMLVFVALVRYAQRHPEKSKALVWSAQEILDDGYLTNKHRAGEDHYKLTLSKGDRAVFQALVDELEQAGYDPEFVRRKITDAYRESPVKEAIPIIRIGPLPYSVYQDVNEITRSVDKSHQSRDKRISERYLSIIRGDDKSGHRCQRDYQMKPEITAAIKVKLRIHWS